jgi:hypothetical protein
MYQGVEETFVSKMWLSMFCNVHPPLLIAYNELLLPHKLRLVKECLTNNHQHTNCSFELNIAKFPLVWMWLLHIHLQQS